jgi:hypothetical protein
MKFKDFLWNSLFLINSLTSYVLEYKALKTCKVVSRPWPSLLGLKKIKDLSYTEVVVVKEKQGMIILLINSVLKQFPIFNLFS